MPDDRIRSSESFQFPPAPIVWQFPALPAWLARRILRTDETVSWVRGPRLNPWWERFATHPAMFLLALLVAAICFGLGALIAGSWSRVPPIFVLVAIVIVVGAVYVLAIGNAYFTRLIVTNFRLVIVQGCEVCKSWHIDVLPRRLLKYGRRGDERPTVDLDALQTMLGGSDQFADSKTIRALGKHLDSFKADEHRRLR